MRLAMPSFSRDAGAFARAVDRAKDRMRVPDRTRVTRGNNVFFRLDPIDRSHPAGTAAAFLFGAPRRAWSDNNDHAHVDRRAAPGRNPGRRHQGKPHRGV
jgi:hypothetical protein